MGHFYSDEKMIYCNDDYLELCIPTEYFSDEKRYAIDYSSYIETFGVFPVMLYQGGKFSEFKTFAHPYTIKVYVYDSATKSLEIPGSGSISCRVFSYTKHAAIMDATLIQDSLNVLTYLDMLMDAKIPSLVPYDKTDVLWQKNQTMNNVGFGIRSEVEEMVLSLYYRNPNNLSQPFGQLYGANLSTSPMDYKMVNTRQICQFASTFSSVTFEDIDSMITTSINRTRDKTEDAYSPVEEVIKM